MSQSWQCLRAVHSTLFYHVRSALGLPSVTVSTRSAPFNPLLEVSPCSSSQPSIASRSTYFYPL